MSHIFSTIIVLLIMIVISLIFVKETNAQSNAKRKRKVGEISKQMCNDEPRYIKFSVTEARKNGKSGIERVRRQLDTFEDDDDFEIDEDFEADDDSEVVDDSEAGDDSEEKFYPSGRGGIGGEDAKSSQYPHMAALGYGEWENVKWGCGGTLISDTFVMTAAHCIDTLLGRLKYIRLDDINLASDDDNSYPQDFNASRIIIHPDYNPPSAYNDIALVELDHPVDRLGNSLTPACLQIDRNIADPKWSALGWGETSHHGPAADHLQVMELREADYTVCKNAYLNAGKRRLEYGVDNDSQMCAGKGDVDTCLGDSGGPLQISNEKYWTGYTVIGITSFGKKCGLTNKPSVYTRVSHYIEWIESVVWPE